MPYTENEIRLLRRFIRGYILALMKPIKPEHIIDYVKKNKVPNIAPFIKTLPKYVLDKVHSILSAKPEILNKWIQPEYVIRKISEERPDLHECIKDPKNRIWLKKFVNYVRSVLRNL